MSGQEKPDATSKDQLKPAFVKTQAELNSIQIEAINNILTELQAKIGTIEQHKWPKAQIKACELLKDLNHARDELIKNMATPEIDLKAAKALFKKNCKDAINKAQPILANDLGWGVYLWNLLKKLISTCVTLGGNSNFFARTQSNSEQIVKGIETKLNQTMPELIPTAICLVVQRYSIPDGLGDLYFQINLFNFLKKEFPNTLITIHPFSKYEEDSFNKLKGAPSLTPLSKIVKTAEQMSTLIIHGPVPSGTLPEIKAPHTLWRINEFNASHRTDKKEEKILNTGIGQGYFGINSFPQLYNVKKQLEEKGLDFDSTKIELLEHEALKTLLLSGTPPDAPRPCYFGYAHGALTKLDYISSVIKGNQGSEPIDICILGQMAPIFKFKTLANMIESHIKEDALAAGINAAEIHEWCKETNAFKTTVIKFREEPGKVLRLILPGVLSQADFLNLLIASQKFVLMTGDQSTAQALALGKIILTDVVGHKTRFNKELFNLLDNPVAASFLNEHGSRYNLPYQDKEVKNSFMRLSETLWRDYNIERNMGEQIKKWVLEMVKNNTSDTEMYKSPAPR